MLEILLCLQKETIQANMNYVFWGFSMGSITEDERKAQQEDEKETTHSCN